MMGVDIGIDDVDDDSVDVMRAPTLATVMVAVDDWALCANNGAQTAQSRRRNILPGDFMVMYIYITTVVFPCSQSVAFFFQLFRFECFPIYLPGALISSKPLEERRTKDWPGGGFDDAMRPRT
jgi:hypothetical protein